MDPRLLKYYEEELIFIREMGAEFAATHPKIASRLGMDGVECLDPYVERLLESHAFLAARIQLQISLQFPVFAQHLLDIVYPHYLAPTPAMTVVKFHPDKTQAGLTDGLTLKRGTSLTSPLREDDRTACEFRTAQDMTFWPIEIVQAEYVSGRGAVVAAGVAEDERAKAAIRLRIGRVGEGPLSDLSIDHLDLFLQGPGATGWELHEQIAAHGLGVVGRSTNRRRDWRVAAAGRAIRDIGYGKDEALLPYPGESFDGYRLLQEYFAIPERFLFTRLGGLQPIFAACEEEELDLVIPVKENLPDLRHTIDPECFVLFAAPAINLFHKRCDRIHIDGHNQDLHVVPERTTPMDFEIHRLTKVTGISGEGGDDVEFRPFYSADDLTAAGESHPAYYAVRRRARQRSEKQRLKGARTSYLGTETYISLVDSRQTPFAVDLKQVAAEAYCTNRDLPMLLPIGAGDTDFVLPAGGPVKAIRSIVGPTRPRPSLTYDGDAAWRLISHLSLNYLSLADSDRAEGASALRELLAIYAPLGEQAFGKQLEGVRSIRTRPIVRRISDRVLSTAVRGQEVEVTFDESFFTGSSVFLLGAVLERFFAKYVSLNSFTETVIRGQDRGEIVRWPARSGTRRLL